MHSITIRVLLLEGTGPAFETAQTASQLPQGGKIFLVQLEAQNATDRTRSTAQRRVVPDRTHSRIQKQSGAFRF